MTIGGKLILIFVLVVAFSGANLSVYFWSKSKSNTAIEELRLATEVQIALGETQHGLNDLSKQNTIMGQFVSGTEDLALHPKDIERFDTQTNVVAESIDRVSSSVGSESSKELTELSAKYEALIKSWRRFYLYFGRDHTEALMELAINAEPLANEVMQIYLPALIHAEETRIKLARENYAATSALTNKLSTSVFLGSTLFLMLILIWFSRDLMSRLTGLRLGAEKIGSGDLDHRIDDKSKDELHDLAESFNEMGGRLLEARDELDEQYRIVNEQRERSQNLLLNILPKSTADELVDNGKVAPQYYSAATVMFADIKGFTLSTEKLSVDKLVEVLNEYFTEFDKICDKYNVEKLKTIGDCYMAVSGVPSRNLSHCADMILAALECIEVTKKLSSREEYPDWEIRIGIHSGPVIAGVVGIKKFAFDIWGSTVNRAARLEASGEANNINISEESRSHVKDLFNLVPRGAIKTKDKQNVAMYFVDGLHPSLLEGRIPPRAGFEERYQVYFREKSEAFPASLEQSSIKK
jgi:class 3 adenylate cyclase